MLLAANSRGNSGLLSFLLLAASTCSLFSWALWYRLQGQMSGRNGEAAGAPGNWLLVTSLYVGDLDFSVTDSQLYDLFSPVGQAVSVTVCRDLSTRRSLGYAYVNYDDPADAARTLDILNFTPLNNKSIRITCSVRLLLWDSSLEATNWWEEVSRGETRVLEAILIIY